MNLPSNLQQIKNSLFDQKEVKVFVKRDDLIHPVISGNKWRKLKFNIEKFKEGKYDKLLTFGGAYSNHIAATARAGKELGISTIGIIRGDELNKDVNSTLKQAAQDGMELVFTKREEYTLRDEKYYHEELRRRHGNIWLVPEGGANYYGVLGCQEITKEIDRQLGNVQQNYIVTACGTGTTAAGLLLSNHYVVGVSVLKGGDFLNENIKTLLEEFYFQDVQENMVRFELATNYHFGGYAKYSAELIDFINAFEKDYDIPLDQVYTAKMMYGLFDLIRADHFPKGSRVVALHTGGLQGRKSIESLLDFRS